MSIATNHKQEVYKPSLTVISVINIIIINLSYKINYTIVTSRILSSVQTTVCVKFVERCARVFFYIERF